MDQTLGATFDLGTGVPYYQVEDEEGTMHLLLHLPIEQEKENRWCLWRTDQAGFQARAEDSESAAEGQVSHPFNVASLSGCAPRA
jgi:hypothetical protein